MDEVAVVELLYNDSSKNISDLKSRQWTATQLSVTAIMALAVLARERAAKAFDWDSPTTAFVLLMFSICAGHLVVFFACKANLGVFRGRLLRMAEKHFPALTGIFEEGETFKSLIVDEGRISLILALCPWITFALGLFLIYSK